MRNKNVVALMYDFDETLSPGYMQDYSLIPELGFEVDKFWNKTNEFGKKNNMDGTLAYLYTVLECAKAKKISLTKEKMLELGKSIQLFEGVDTWFDRINEYGKSLGLTVEHYIISSGMKEIIEGTTIAKKFKKIFACSYCYDKNGQPYWPCQAVNFTNKTQYVFRVRKNDLEDLNSSKAVNDLVDEESKLPYKNMIYFGDGQTDVPCMKLLKSKGGNAFCVFNPSSKKAIEVGMKLFNDKRVDYIAPTIWTENSDIDKFVKSILNNIAKDYNNELLLKKYIIK